MPRRDMKWNPASKTPGARTPGVFDPDTRHMKTALYLLTGLFALARACNARVQAPAAPVPFRLPDIPAVLTAPEDRAAYLSVHYWDHFDFKDPSLIERAEVTEQAFVDFISILPYAGNAPGGGRYALPPAAADRRMLDHFITLGDKYLYEPNSPMHNEELYILVLRAQLANPALTGRRRSARATCWSWHSKTVPGIRPPTSPSCAATEAAAGCRRSAPPTCCSTSTTRSATTAAA